MNERRVLLVDDEIEIRDRFARIISNEGYCVQKVKDGKEALELFKVTIFPIVITDLKMPKIGGLSVLKNIKEIHPPTQVIIITGYGEKKDAIKALKLHAFDYIEKGSSTTLDNLLSSLERAFIEYDIKTENIEELSDKLETFEQLYNSSIPYYIDLYEYENHDEAFCKLGEQEPDFYAFLESAVVEGKRKNYETAAGFFMKALTICPDNAYALLHAGLTYEKLGNFKKYREYFIKSFQTAPVRSFYLVDKHIKGKDNIEIALHKAERERHTLKEDKILAEAELKTQKEMLSFLTHTLRNTFAGIPRAVKQILEIAHTELGDQYKEKSFYKVFNRLSYLLTIFTTVSNMIDTYKLYGSEPELIHQKWQQDQEGTVSIRYLLATVLKQTLGRIMFETQHLNQFKRLLASGHYTIKEVRESFLSEMLIRDLRPETVEELFSWIATYFPIIDLQIEEGIEEGDVFFNPNGIRFNILFAIISEIIYNAVKYADSTNQVFISWKHEQQNFAFTCQNAFCTENIEATGSQKGLTFISGLLKMIKGIKFSHKPVDSRFIVQLHIPQTLLYGGSEA